MMSMESHHTAHVVIAYDATKDRTEHEFKLTLESLQSIGDFLLPGDKLIVLGVLDRVLHPMGYQLKAWPGSYPGLSIRAMEEEVAKRVDAYLNMILQSAGKCEDNGVSIEVKITAGFPAKQVVLQEAMTLNARWVILDRYFRRDLRSYLRQIPSRVAVIQDSFCVKILRSRTIKGDIIENKLFYSFSKPVLFANAPSSEKNEQSVTPYEGISITSLENSEMVRSSLINSSTYKTLELNPLLNSASFSEPVKSVIKGENIYSSPSQIVPFWNESAVQQKSTEARVLCTACVTRIDLYVRDSMKFSYSDIKLATSDFSEENLLGEGGYGYVYRGKLKNGQHIAAKVRKEESTQGFAEFHSEVLVLSFARHKNIVMLLGHCCKERSNILVYEYICNKSLDWHLFVKETPLEWHQRLSIAIGTAKGLRFLHEECRGGPIIHRDVKPRNILLTHDFVPMLGDFGLAKWKTNDDPLHTRILGSFGYLAPEYAEHGILSVQTDVYAFGVVLLQLISGRRVIDSKHEQKLTLQQWAEPLIKNGDFQELVDARLGNVYDANELHLMAQTASLCVERNPELRPSMGEIVRLLEGESDHSQFLLEQFVAHDTVNKYDGFPRP